MAALDSGVLLAQMSETGAPADLDEVSRALVVLKCWIELSCLHRHRRQTHFTQPVEEGVNMTRKSLVA